MMLQKEFIHTKKILIDNQCAQLLRFFLSKLCHFNQTAKQIRMTNTNLKLFQTNGTQILDNQGNNLTVCIHGIISDKFHTQLGTFLEAPLITVIIDKNIAFIAQTNRRCLNGEIFSRRSGNRRCDIRSEHQGISLPVKEFV